MLIDVVPAKRLAVDLGDAVEGIGPDLGGVVVDAVVVQVVERRRGLQLVGADGVVGGGEDDAGHPGPARRLEDVVGADQI